MFESFGLNFVHRQKWTSITRLTQAEDVVQRYFACKDKSRRILKECDKYVHFLVSYMYLSAFYTLTPRIRAYTARYTFSVGSLDYRRRWIY